MFSAVYNYEMNCRMVFRTGESRESFLEYTALAAGNLILDSIIFSKSFKLHNIYWSIITRMHNENFIFARL